MGAFTGVGRRGRSGRVAYQRLSTLPAAAWARRSSTSNGIDLLPKRCKNSVAEPIVSAVLHLRKALGSSCTDEPVAEIVPNTQPSSLVFNSVVGWSAASLGHRAARVRSPRLGSNPCLPAIHSEASQ